jgi:hypothetical protein
MRRGSGEPEEEARMAVPSVLSGEEERSEKNQRESLYAEKSTDQKKSEMKRAFSDHHLKDVVWKR